MPIDVDTSEDGAVKCRSLREALLVRGAEFHPDGSGRWYAGGIHRSSAGVNAELRPLIEDPGDRRYFRLQPGEDHRVTERAYRSVSTGGDDCGESGLLQFRDL